MIHESGLDTKLGPGFKDSRGAASGFLVSLCKTGVTELRFLRGLMWRKNALYTVECPFIVATCQNPDLKGEGELLEEGSHPRYLLAAIK